MGNSYENVGRFGKSPGGRFTKSSYKFSSLLVRRRPMGNSYENVGRFGKGYVSFRLIRKCRAIWQIARTIYQIVLQIFIPLGAP
ncbi:MAG: hypothetical protein V9G20_07720 [Candidatus Promineifilaceae bacterium]